MTSGRDAPASAPCGSLRIRQMYTAVQASSRKKHMPLNTYISLYSKKTSGRMGDGNEENSLMNAIPAALEMSPEELLSTRGKCGRAGAGD